jgi:hypothetical protein
MVLAHSRIGAIRISCSWPSTTAAVVVCGDREPNGGVAGALNDRSIPLGDGAVTTTEHLAARSRLGCEPWASGTGPPRSARPGRTDERLIESVGRECTDHLIAFNAEHLRRILRNMPSIITRFERMSLEDGRALHTPDRAVRRRCCASDPWRAPSSVRSNLDFGSDSQMLQNAFVVGSRGSAGGPMASIPTPRGGRAG